MTKAKEYRGIGRRAKLRNATFPMPLQGALCPQDVAKGELEGKIKKPKIFTLFKNYMTSFDGGQKTYSKEEVSNVARLLYQVDKYVNDCSLLWRPESVAIIRRRFFEGNP